MIELNDIKMIFGTGVSSSKDYHELRGVVQGCFDNGIRAFDTAPSYGTESLLGSVLTSVGKGESIMQRSEYWIQTKIDPWQMQEKAGDIESYIQYSLDALGTSYFDAVLIHWPIPEYVDATLQSLEMAKAKGLIRYIGVCNVRKRQVERLLLHDYEVDIVQIERHPLRTCEEDIEFFKYKDIAIQAYSPLCKMNRKIRENTILQSIAEKNGCSIGQLVMRWHLNTGIVPVFTTKKISRIKEYSTVSALELGEKDINLINKMNENYKMYLESWLCPGF